MPAPVVVIREYSDHLAVAPDLDVAPALLEGGGQLRNRWSRHPEFRTGSPISIFCQACWARKATTRSVASFFMSARSLLAFAVPVVQVHVFATLKAEVLHLSAVSGRQVRVHTEFSAVGILIDLW